MKAKWKITKDIQKKILEADFKTDSDIEDFSKENISPLDDVLRVLLNNNYLYSSCHGCSFILNKAYPSIYSVCNNCSRANKLEDNYVTDLRFVEED